MKPWTMAGIFLSGLIIVFYFVGVGGGFLLPLTAGAVILVGVGVITGQ